MKMLLLSAILSLITPQVFAGDAICAARPDLCGGKVSRAKRKPASRGGRAEIMRAAEEIEDDIEHEFDDDSRRAPSRATRRPASARYAPLPGAVTYESYLQANASHPAIARRPANMAGNQKAFVTPTIQTTITGSTLDQPAAFAPNKVGDAQPAAGGVNPSDTPTNLPDMNGPSR